MNNIKKRNLNCDFIRAIAVLCVIAVHFFYNSGFYREPVIGLQMYSMVNIRTLFMVCVPLFMILTGFLMNRKQLSKQYYKSLPKTLGIYVLASIACIIYTQIETGVGTTLVGTLLLILQFQGAKYSWYIEMYIGLFLLIPFLNIMYNGLDTRKKKLVLIFSLLICTTLPSILNIFDFYMNVPDFWTMPSLSDKYNAIVPDWWVSIYPITYYFIGAYIKEYGVKIPMIKNVLLFIVCVLAFGGFNFYRNYPGLFQPSIFVSWGSFQNVITSVLLFMILIRLKLERTPRVIGWMITKISELSLCMYLVSYIFDHIFYKQLAVVEPYMPDRFSYFLLIVPSVFICSAVLSQGIAWIYKLIDYGVSKLVKLKARQQKDR